MAAISAGAVFGAAATSPASAATTAGHAGDQLRPYYVAIGASESVGVQPVPGDPRGVRTDQGYANDLTTMEQDRWPGLQLADFGCSGITAQGALDGGGRCHYPAGSEVATALDFIRAHRARVSVVTVDLGFNDLEPCLAHHSVDAGCVDDGIHRVAAAVSTILAELRAAGGQHLLIVGLEHTDPYVADAHFGEVAFARSTVTVLDRMNAVLSDVYTEAHAVVARVPEIRDGAATGLGAIETACARTWMCTDHNIHPTAAGYRAIADAVAAAISRASGG